MQEAAYGATLLLLLMLDAAREGLKKITNENQTKIDGTAVYHCSNRFDGVLHKGKWRYSKKSQWRFLWKFKFAVWHNMDCAIRK